MKRSSASLAAILLVAMSAACSGLLGASTPEEAARQNSTRISPEAAATFRVLGTRRWERGTVVLYTYLWAQKQMLGFALATQTPSGAWEVSNAGAGDADPPVPEDLVDYREGGGSGAFGLGEYSIVLGQTLAPEVARVQVTFANGQVLQDDAADGVFALIAPVSSFGCELRVFSAKGELLRRVAMPGQLAPGSRCPRSIE